MHNVNHKCGTLNVPEHWEQHTDHKVPVRRLQQQTTLDTQQCTDNFRRLDTYLHVHRYIRVYICMYIHICCNVSGMWLYVSFCGVCSNMLQTGVFFFDMLS